MAGVPTNSLNLLRDALSGQVPLSPIQSDIQKFPKRLYDMFLGGPLDALQNLGMTLADPGSVEIGPNGEVSPMDPRLVDNAAELTANFGAPGASVASTIRPDPNILNIFAGPKSLTADHEALIEAILKAREVQDLPKVPSDKITYLRDNAQLMNDVKGVRDTAKELTPDQQAEIFAATGWFPGADNKWRYEIPDMVRPRAGFPNIDQAYAKSIQDSTAYNKRMYPDMSPEQVAKQAEYSSKMITPVARVGALDQFLSHPDAFDAYPELAGLKTLIQATPWGSPAGTFHLDPFERQRGKPTDPGSPQIIDVQGLAQNENISTLLHEMQHGVQSIEGFANGGNPKAAGQSLAELAPGISEQLSMPTPYQLYRALIGETEARNVQTRWELGTGIDSPMAGLPTITQDIPTQFQISPMELAYPAQNAPGGIEAFKTKLMLMKSLLGDVIPK